MTTAATRAGPAAQPSVTLYHGDCLDVMPKMAPATVNLLFADLPYGVTDLRKSWDRQLDLESYWKGALAQGKEGCAFIFTATQPFATQLVVSNPKLFRYDIIWHKRSVGFLHAKRRPLRSHEHVLVFGKKLKTYNPQKTYGHRNYSQKRGVACKAGAGVYGSLKQPPSVNDGSRFPHSVLTMMQAEGKVLHPTQKPVALLEWLIKTYTNEGDTVLDPVAGSGTTAIAALRTGRNVVCIEKDPAYFEVMRKRIADEQARLDLAQAG